jgi:SAM-dependent methyltransferase
LISSRITNPLTGTARVRLIEKLSVSRIIENYKSDLNIDVSRFFSTEKLSIYECCTTGFRFYYPFDTCGDERLYHELQDKSYYSEWNWEHEFALKNISIGEKILEIGCGTGSFIERLSQVGFDIAGIELNEKAVNACKLKGLNVSYKSIEEHCQNHPNDYTAICSFQVLEHVVDPKSFINNCLKMLKSGGKLIFGVPNNNPYLFRWDKYHTLNLPPHHMGLWNLKACKRLPMIFDMELISVTVEKLYNTKYYLETLLNHYRLYNKGIVDRIPDYYINLIAKKLNWKGRNIVAIYIKK